MVEQSHNALVFHNQGSMLIKIDLIFISFISQISNTNLKDNNQPKTPDSLSLTQSIINYQRKSI
jgi:hypothetical protein